MFSKTVEQLLEAELIEELGYNRYIGRMICTTIAAEGCHRQLRKRTKSKSMVPTPQAARKLLYLATIDITEKVDIPHSQLGFNPQSACHPL